MQPLKPINSQLPFDEQQLTEFWKSINTFSFTRGKIPLHHLLMHAAYHFREEKDVEINIMSFSIGEDALRAVLFIKEHLPAVQIRVILDSSCRSNKMNYLIPFQEQCDVRFNHIHVKAFQVTSPIAPGMLLISSANLQSKDRWEIHNKYLDYGDNMVFTQEFNRIWNESAP